jgi:1,4-dihydroxy-2-naphthoate octaprenyltransferase
MGSIFNYVIATRPWSFTVSVMGVLLTANLINKHEGIPVLSRGCWEAMALCVLLQASGNLLNSYFDFKNGVDNPSTTGDRCLVDKTVSVPGTLLVAAVLAVAAVGLLAPKLLAPDHALLYVFLASVTLAVSYTAPPLRLKYRALGDVVIFTCFGPLLMRGSAIIISGQPHSWTLPYAVPITLLTEAILHANNSRDIKEDAKCGIHTLAIKLGYPLSRVVYYGMVAGAYLSALALSYSQYVGCSLVLLSLPLAVSTLRAFKPSTMSNMDERTAQLHLLFCLLLNIGVHWSPGGIQFTKV